MYCTLDELLSKIAPEQIIDPTHRAIDEAIATFPTPGPPADSDEFDDLMLQFLIHVEQHIVGATSPRPIIPVYDLGRVIEILEEVYGQATGYKTARELAQHGYEGGRKEVLEQFAKQFGRRHTSNMVRAAVSDFLWDLSGAELQQVAVEYMDRYTPLLPPEWVEKGPGFIAGRLKELLVAHPYSMMETRAQGR